MLDLCHDFLPGSFVGVLGGLLEDVEALVLVLVLSLSLSLAFVLDFVLGLETGAGLEMVFVLDAVDE